MGHKDLIFDLESSRLGVVEARCPEFRKARVSPYTFDGEKLGTSSLKLRSWQTSVLSIAGLCASVLLFAQLACCCIRKCSLEHSQLRSDDEEPSDSHTSP